MSFKKDNVFTICLPGSELVFTRYLYLKDEVRIALLVCLLNKSDDALFWAYELYHSGFKFELFDLIINIYYDFYYTLNPSFEQYILKKYKESNKELTECMVSALIQNLLYRPFNTDVFMLKNICKLFEIETNYADTTKKITNSIELINSSKLWITNNDYRSIANWIINENKDFNLLVIYETIIQIFEEQGLKLSKTKLLKDFDKINVLNVDIKIVLVAKILAIFSKRDKLKKGRSIYVPVKIEEIKYYETLITEKAYHVLEMVCNCGIDDFHYLSLFKLKRQKYNIKNKYWFNWLYHASFSPIWSKRIHEHGGYPDYFKQTIVFKEEPTDDLMQLFYSLYGYEPDEQKTEIQEKSIIDIKKTNNWLTFYKNYRKNGIVEVEEEELEEFDVDGITY
jgi:hypothetical protein